MDRQIFFFGQLLKKFAHHWPRTWISIKWWSFYSLWYHTESL